MNGPGHPSRRTGVLAFLGLVLLMAPASNVVASFHHTPMVLDLTGDQGDAWAVAIKSDDEPTSHKGNELVLSVVLNGDPVRSVASMGIYELVPDPEHEFRFRTAMIGSSMRGEERVFFDQVDGVEGTPDSPDLELTPVFSDDGKIGAMGELRSMEPGEWRYFVAWAAGSEESRFRLRGEGFEIRELVEGEGIAMGNSELLGEEGLYARQGTYLPSQASTGDGYVGGGAAVTTDAGVALETHEPLLGGFLTYHLRYACTGLGLSSCINAGTGLEEGASRVVESGLANTSLATPEAGHVWQRTGKYMLMPGKEGDHHYVGTTPGTYEFRVDHLVNVVGPSYRDPIWGHGARLDGSQLVLSLAEIDYLSLADASDA